MGYSGSILDFLERTRLHHTQSTSTVINIRPFHLLCSILVAVLNVVQRRIRRAPRTLKWTQKDQWRTNDEQRWISLIFNKNFYRRQKCQYYSFWYIRRGNTHFLAISYVYKCKFSKKAFCDKSRIGEDK